MSDRSSNTTSRSASSEVVVEAPEAAATTGEETPADPSIDLSAAAPNAESVEPLTESAAPDRAADLAPGDAETAPTDSDAETAETGETGSSDGGETAAAAADDAPPVGEAEGEESGGAAAPPRKGLSAPQLEPLEAARATAEPLEGKVIGWNQGGFHVVLLDTIPSFCPRSEMELGPSKAPKSYLDRSFPFLILRIEEDGRRIVLSRAAVLRHQRAQKRKDLRKKITPGAVLSGRVASLTDFGAFVDVGGVQGLVHVSEISRQRVNKPSDVLAMGQRVEVKVLKVEQGGRRVSLSMKALEPDPWSAIRERFAEGKVVPGKVEKVAPFGAFVELEPGLTGLLPNSTVNIPQGTSLARMFPPGKEITVQIMSLDPRRRRISLALEGSSAGGSQADYESYKKVQRDTEEGGFNALAAAFRKVRGAD